MSILNVEISCFRDYYTKSDPRTVSLLTWLQSEKYADQVRAIRRSDDPAEIKKLKALLPAITPSGIFGRCENDALLKHSGLVCLDIDQKGNELIDNFGGLADQLRRVQNIAYVGQSVSGKGWFCLVPIAEPSRHIEHCEALQNVFFDTWKILLDPVCKNVSRLRGYSFDPAAYFNHAAVPHRLPPPAPREKFIWQSAQNGTATRDKVARLIAKIASYSIDIAPSYSEWFELGCSLAAEFGEDGRGYFHAASQFHPKYKNRQTDQQFDACLKTSHFTIATFFHLCEQAGVIDEPKTGLATFKTAAPIADQKTDRARTATAAKPPEPPQPEPPSEYIAQPITLKTCPF